MKRIATRFVVFAVIYATIVYILPALIDLIGSISNTFRSIPSWGYYTCCGVGFIFFTLTFITQYRFERDQEKTQAVYKEITNEFENRINNNPAETKEIYLELRAAVRRHDNATASDLAEKIYGRKNVYKNVLDEQRHQVLPYYQTTSTSYFRISASIEIKGMDST